MLYFVYGKNNTTIGKRERYTAYVSTSFGRTFRT